MSSIFVCSVVAMCIVTATDRLTDLRGIGSIRCSGMDRVFVFIVPDQLTMLPGVSEQEYSDDWLEVMSLLLLIIVIRQIDRVRDWHRFFLGTSCIFTIKFVYSRQC